MYFVAECTTRSASQVQRLLEQGGGEGVVDDDVGAGLVGGLGDRRDVGDLHGGVGGRLDPDEGRVVAGRDHGLGVADVDELRLDAVPGLEVGELHHRAVVGVPRRDHLLPGADQVEDRRHGGQPAGEGEAATALEVAECLLEGAPGRVVVAAVLQVPAGDVRRGHRDRGVERLVGLVRGTTDVDGAGGGTHAASVLTAARAPRSGPCAPVGSRA